MTTYRHVFGPVPSRRFGRSLGVDLIQGFFLQHPNREMSYDFAGAAL